MEIFSKQQQIISIGLKWNLGNEKNILFRHHPWITSILMKSCFLDFFLYLCLNQNAFVSEVYSFDERDFQWNLIFSRVLEGEFLIQYMKSINSLKNFNMYDKRTKLYWLLKVLVYLQSILYIRC